ncbi:MAG: APC family permease [Candidatus Methanomethylophilaceae archaeon]
MTETSHLQRTIGWKQGMLIALGVPILILPSIGYSAGYLWGFSIVLWILSVLQGFVQNAAFGEMTTTFPDATGLPGCAQKVFSKGDDSKSKYDRGKFIGAFCAWCYWFAWCPVVAIFTLTIGTYVRGFVPDVADAGVWLDLLIGLAVVVGMTIIGAHGLTGGSFTALILALISLVPLVIILVAPFFTGDFTTVNITGNWLPLDWSWGSGDIVIFLGLMAMAQWSACAWETAAVYGPEYKKPRSDVPKALFSCGIICLMLYALTQMSVVGTLGIDGIANAPVDPLNPMSQIVFGDAGQIVAMIMLICAMLMIIQTGFLGSSRTLYSMSLEGNMPRWFSKTNARGNPVNAMIFVSVFNLTLVLVQNPVAVLAASSMGYALAVGIALAAYYKSKTVEPFKSMERPFGLPGWYRYVALIMAVYEIGVLLPCLVYLNYMDYDAISVVLGVVILFVFVPIWMITQNYLKENRSGKEPVSNS